MSNSRTSTGEDPMRDKDEIERELTNALRRIDASAEELGRLTNEYQKVRESRRRQEEVYNMYTNRVTALERELGVLSGDVLLRENELCERLIDKGLESEAKSLGAIVDQYIQDREVMQARAWEEGALMALDMAEQQTNIGTYGAAKVRALVVNLNPYQKTEP